ncbi:MAG: DUF790 family protein [Candidatus Bathyarchaeia archaeon]
MLPGELLTVWKRKGELTPRYAKLTAENLQAAETLIKAYSAHVGGKKRAVKEHVSDLEIQGFDYRFIRGLSVLLDRRSQFTCNSKVDPIELRRRLFSAAGTWGIPTTQTSRIKILEETARQMALDPEEAEEYIYADLEDELILAAFKPPSAVDLLKQYNLSLTQTLLFDSVVLSFTASGNWQRLLYSVKRLGLIYDAFTGSGSGFWVKVDGPVSLFKLTKKYGVNIAKLLPEIVTCPEWSLEAKILWKYTNEVCRFRIDSRQQGPLLLKPTQPQKVYDSSVEENFATQFQALNSGWKLKREPEPITARKHLILPDFSLEKGPIKVYVEIVGFWTEDYLNRKVEKLKLVDVNMILLVDENLSCGKLSSLEKLPKLHFIYYSGEIPMSQVLRHLSKTFEDWKSKEVYFLKTLPIKFTEEAVKYVELAERFGVSPEAVKAVFASSPPAGYVALTNGLVSLEKLEKLQNKIEERLKMGKLSLNEAAKIIEDEGVSDASNVLNRLGYKVRWSGINIEKAEVYRPQS